MNGYVRRALAEEDALDAFRCGRDSVDSWLRERAWSSRHQVATTVFLDGSTVVGFYAMKSVVVGSDALPSRYRQFANADGAVPGILLCQMGVAESHHGRGHGLDVFTLALQDAVQSFDVSRTPLMVVDAADEELVRFYEQHCNMTRTDPASLRLVTSLSAASKAMSRAAQQPE